MSNQEEYLKEYLKEYRKRDYVIEQRRAYHRTPEAKAKAKARREKCKLLAKKKLEEKS